jgi:hypothetical protein
MKLQNVMIIKAVRDKKKQQQRTMKHGNFCDSGVIYNNSSQHEIPNVTMNMI